MIEKVIKRNGDVVDFDKVKIINAINNARNVTKEFTEEMINILISVIINYKLKDKNKVSVEYIQDVIQGVLVNFDFPKTVNEFILYRYKRKLVRESKIKSDIVNSYLGDNEWRVKENSNMTFSLQGLNNYIYEDVIVNYWLNSIYPKNIKNAHINGDIHIHDLGSLSVYCVGWDLMDILLTGFGGVSGKIESKPPKHFRTALGQIINFFYTLQGEAAGAQALSNFDTLLAPFIHEDNLDYIQVKQALQEFVFNTNVPTRVGFQTPFTNITMDLTPPKFLKDSPIIIGGEYKNNTYSFYQNEMNMLNKAFTEVMMEGDAKGRVFSFPIPTYNITKDFDWDSEHIDNVWKMAGKYGIPYFSNFVNSDMSPDDARSMCCRLRLDNRELIKRGGGLFGSNPLTGSIGVVTINLPRIGYLSNNLNEFCNRLNEMIEISIDSLRLKRKALEKFTDNNLYPYSKHYLRMIKEKTGLFWTNHFSTIGIIGMNEALLNFIGKDIGTKSGQNLSKEIMRFINTKISSYDCEMLNLEATPAEGTSYRLAKIDKKQFPDIITSNEIVPQYTNSTNLPVNYTDDIFEALDLQNDLQTMYTGGTVLHMFLEERIDNINTVKNLVEKITSNYNIPYFTLSPTFSICKNHGYLKGEVKYCPECNEITEIFSRIVGYIRPVKQWNIAKQEEFKNRKTFKCK